MRYNFLNRHQIENLKNHQYQVTDYSITTTLYTPLWNEWLNLLPLWVAPNLLTLTGFAFLLWGAIVTYFYGDYHPEQVAFLNMMNLFIYQTLDALDGKQARRIDNSTPMGELLDHTCDNFAVSLIIYMLCRAYQVESLLAIYLTMTLIHLCFLRTHLIALYQRTLEFGTFTGPGEALAVCQFLLANRAMEWIPLPISSFLLITLVLPTILLVMYEIHQLNLSIKDEIRNIFVIHLFTIGVYHLWGSVTYWDLLANACFWSLVTGDIILAKMAEREIHEYVVSMTIFQFLNNQLMITVTFYYLWNVFSQISTELDLPYLTTF